MELASARPLTLDESVVVAYLRRFLTAVGTGEWRGDCAYTVAGRSTSRNIVSSIDGVSGLRVDKSITPLSTSGAGRIASTFANAGGGSNRIGNVLQGIPGCRKTATASGATRTTTAGQNGGSTV